MDGIMMSVQADIPQRPARVWERWTDDEIAIIRRTYPVSGAPGCQEVMPHRSLSSIYNQANLLKIKHSKSKPVRASWTTTDQIDAAIIRVYQSDPTKGQLALLCRKVQRPRYWVRRRAIALGVAVAREKEPKWSDAELQILETVAHLQPKAIQRRLKKAGFSRTEAAIAIKLKRGDFDRTDIDHFTARALGACMGVDASTVERWITKLGLQAKRRGTNRVEAQGGDQWWIHRKDFRRFVIENAAIVDLRKIVDKEWFIDLLANGR